MLVDAILVFGETLIDTFHHFLIFYTEQLKEEIINNI